ncbi:hypothetical protein D027_0909B, partial [Vibrio parahaemolyticus 861]
YKLGGLG